MKNVSEICLEIDNILKKQDIPFEVYKQLNDLLCDVIRIHSEKVEDVDKVLKEVYLDVANNYEATDLSSKSDIVACVASVFREKVYQKIN
jgi:hypothetical protein